MIYAYVKSDGYVQFVQNNGEQQDIPGLSIVILDEPLPPCQNENFSFNINTKVWEDARTDQQKYNDQVTLVTHQRNELLYKSDWTQIPNNPLSLTLQQQLAIYRQELRDIPKQSGYPFNVIWPVPPN
jgi:hypothetical protein